MPSLPGPSLADIRKEVERNAIRARNGIKWAAGSEFAPPHPTPSDVIWSSGKAQVRRYRRDTPARFRQPVVAFLGLMSRSYVFDLYEDGSIVRMLMDHGFDAYVMDWGAPDAQDAENTLETYLENYLAPALQAVCEESGSEDVTALAYCMGGLMLVQGLAGGVPLPVRSAVTLASPFDWSELDATTEALRDGRIKADDVLDRTTGNLPGSVIRESFKRRKPTSGLVNYANLWQNLWNDQYVEGYQAIGRFLSDHIDLPGAVFRQMVQQWVLDNGFVTDRLRFHGRRASLADVRCPVLAVVAERDDIAPPEAACAVVDVLPNAEVEVLRVDAGHVSLFAGRQAVKVVMPSVFTWIEHHSEEVTTHAR